MRGETQNVTESEADAPEPEGGSLSTQQELDVTPEVAAEVDKARGEPRRRGLLGFLSWIRTSD
ncbi:MAG: hypothetical protein JO064_02185 [Actinobacteria bacterium]|nr:hypothetical protein [Actinomycetota bacterium]MBV8598805.1 hypothetical protein [Actinomycetota bacterium]